MYTRISEPMCIIINYRVYNFRIRFKPSYDGNLMYRAQNRGTENAFLHHLRNTLQY